MYNYGSYQSNILASLQELWYEILGVLPDILAAIIILVLGWIIANFLGMVVRKVLEALKIDTFANRLGLHELSSRTGRQLSIAKLGQWLVKWFFLIAVFIAASNILGLNQVSVFLYDRVFPYFGNVIVAVAIMMIGIVAASFLSDLVKGALSAGEMRSANALAAITKWAILIFTVLAALSQLNVARAFLENLFTAIVGMLALAGGLAFGLGGRDHAKKVLDSIEHDLTK